VAPALPSPSELPSSEPDSCSATVGGGLRNTCTALNFVMIVDRRRAAVKDDVLTGLADDVGTGCAGADTAGGGGGGTGGTAAASALAAGITCEKNRRCCRVFMPSPTRSPGVTS